MSSSVRERTPVGTRERPPQLSLIYLPFRGRSIILKWISQKQDESVNNSNLLSFWRWDNTIKMVVRVKVKLYLYTPWTHLGGVRDIVPFVLIFNTRWRWVWLILIHVAFECARTILNWILNRMGVCGLSFSGSVRGPVADFCEQGNETLVSIKRGGIYWLADELLISQGLFHAVIFTRFKIFAINESTLTIRSNVVFYAEDDALSTVWVRPMNSRTQTSADCITDIVAGALSASFAVSWWELLPAEQCIVCTHPY